MPPSATAVDGIPACIRCRHEGVPRQPPRLNTGFPSEPRHDSYMSGTSGVCGGHVRVLIVDHEPALTELLYVAVTEAGRRPCPAADGEGALRIARSSAPHAVVLDGMLPVLDGLQVLRSLRYESPRLPVLMLTARDALEHRLDGLEAGADDYVTKPFSPEGVVLRLRGLRRRTDTHRRLRTRPRRPGDQRGDPRGAPRRHARPAHRQGVRPAQPADGPSAPGDRQKGRSSTGCGPAASTAATTSSRCTSPACAARSTGAGPR